MTTLVDYLFDLPEQCWESWHSFKVGFFDNDDDGVVDNPELFDIVIEPTLSESTKFVFFEKYISYDSIERYKPYAASNFVVTEKETDIDLNTATYNDGQLFYFYDSAEDVVKKYVLSTNTFTTTTDYYARRGRSSIDFQYKHNAGQETRIDPSVSNIVELTILQTTYYTNVLNWFYSGKGVADLPVQPTSAELKNNLTELEKYKTIGDQIVYSPAKFKLLFGTTANTAYQANFRVVKIPGATYTDNQIKTEVINAINNYFDVSNWNFGDTFYFTELSAYVHSELASQISSVVIVPKDSESRFGNLFQIKADSNELFFSTAAVSDVEIVTSLTGANLRYGGGS